jgi:uncharacterized RDD family membrane protein YckC
MDSDQASQSKRLVLPLRARSFQGLRAGFVSRALAGVIDALVVAAFTACVVIGWSLLRSLGHQTFELSIPGTWGAFVLGEVVLCFYLWSGWTTTGRSIGKQVMGLRIVNPRGELMRSGTALLRAILCVIFPVGLLWCLFSGHNYSFVDIVLRTSVIHDWHVGVPPRAERRLIRRREHDGRNDQSQEPYATPTANKEFGG